MRMRLKPLTARPHSTTLLTHRPHFPPLILTHPIHLILCLFFSIHAHAASLPPRPFSPAVNSLPALSLRRACPLVLTPDPRPSDDLSTAPSRILSRNPRHQQRPRQWAQRIVGSTEATNDVRRVLVSLLLPNNSFACTGTLLSPRWVLTARHCGVTSSWIARVGGKTAESGRTVRIQRVIAYRPSSIDARLDVPGDIALIQLAKVANLSSRVVVNDDELVPTSGAFSRAVGFGRTDALTPPNPPAANMADSPVHAPARCLAIYAGTYNVSASYFVCTGYDRSRCTAQACSGDSGGPLFQYAVGAASSRRPVLIGVQSFGVKCGLNSLPSVYVRVSAFTSWMAANGAKFTTIRNLPKGIIVQQKFADGSATAANPSPDPDALHDAPDASRGNVVQVPRATFAVVCAIAAVALIALAVLSVATLRGKRLAQREAAKCATGGGGGDAVGVLHRKVEGIEDGGAKGGNHYGQMKAVISSEDSSHKEDYESQQQDSPKHMSTRQQQPQRYRHEEDEDLEPSIDGDSGGSLSDSMRTAYSSVKASIQQHQKRVRYERSGIGPG